MTRWTGTQRRKDSPLMGILPLPILDPVDSTSERYKSTGQGISSTVGSEENLDKPSKIFYPNFTSSSTCEPSSSSSSSNSTKPESSNQEDGVVSGSGNEVGSSVVSSNNNSRDVFRNAIPLPAPPTSSMGSACGGNQSYLGNLAFKNQSLARLQDNRPTSPPFIGGGNFGSSFHSASSLSSRPAGIVGLINLGNTCFMNSGLQCLFNTPRIVEYFLKCENIIGMSPSEKMLVFEFQSLIRNVWLGSATTLRPQEFKSCLGNIYSQFKDCRQHDCQEFLISTLDVLHEQLKQWNNLKKQDNECGSSTIITTSGTNDSSSTSSGVSSASASDTDISSSQTSPGEMHCEVHSAGLGSPQTKKRKLIGGASNQISYNLNPSLVEQSNLIPSGSLSEEDSGTESFEKASNLIEPEIEGEVILGLDIDHDSRSDEIDLEVDVEDSDHEARSDQDDSLAGLVKEAEEFWMKYIRENNTVIASSFQGMYKSTVTCSDCNYISRTYEPFMYLSLPIPRQAERQFAVTFSSLKDTRPRKVDVTMNTGDTVGKLKEAVINKVLVNLELGAPTDTFVVAEVLNYHVFRILGDETLLKNVYDGSRNVYVFELNQDFDDDCSIVYTNPESPDKNAFKFDEQFQQSSSKLLRPQTYLDEDWEKDTPVTYGPQTYLQQQSSDNYPATITGDVYDQSGPVNETYIGANGGLTYDPTHPGNWIQCAVCLEDCLKTELRQHYGCACILCVECMKKTASHYILNDSSKTSPVTAEEEARNTLLKCPVCAEEVDYEKSFLPLVETSLEGEGSQRKLHLVPLLFRSDPDTDTNNNSPQNSRLIGHPWVLKLPSTIPATEFHEFISKINPFPHHNFKVLNSSWDGKACGQCLYTISCKGCELPSEGIISINPRNSIMISYSNLESNLVESIEPHDMAITQTTWSCLQREEPIIDIYECLTAFSEIENLDDQNPTWYCPNCKQNRCATKALTVCRVPDYLIVYLKRFVFMDHSSNKLNNRLKFPLTDLDISEYIAEEFAGDQHIYDLYACVCHYGSSSSGHYTAYGKNPENGEWNYFNDSSVTSKVPSEDEFSSAYVLFYSRKGLKCDIPSQRNLYSTPLHGTNQFRFDTSLNEHNSSKDACDSTSIFPDLEESSIHKLSVGKVGVKLDAGKLNEIVGCLPASSNQDDNPGLDSTSTSHEFYHGSSLSQNDAPTSTTTSSTDNDQHEKKVNNVREDVNNLSLCSSSSDNQEQNSPGTPKRRKIPIRSSSSSTSRYSSEAMETEVIIDQDPDVTIIDDDNECEMKVPSSSSSSYANFCMENSARPTKTAVRPNSKNVRLFEN